MTYADFAERLTALNFHRDTSVMIPPLYDERFERWRSVNAGTASRELSMVVRANESSFVVFSVESFSGEDDDGLNAVIDHLRTAG